MSEVTRNWVDLLRDEVAARGSIAVTARFIGVSSAAVSTALAGKYPGGTDKLEAKVLKSLRGAVTCPHLGETIHFEDCSFNRTRGIPGTREKIDHWLACQECPIGDRLCLPQGRNYQRASHAQR
ncbi:MAG TPA: hypothetical protein VGF92_01555 [Stellaceae bacterium]|jgi:hypothetical protein